MHNPRQSVNFFLVSFFIILIVLCPSEGYPVTLTGNVVTLNSYGMPVGVKDIYIYLYEKEDVLENGLEYSKPAGVSDQNGYFSISNVSLNKDYLLLFSTRAMAGEERYLDFFYGKSDPYGSYVIDTRLDPEIAPTLKFSYDPFVPINISGSYPSYILIPEGFALRGLVKDESGDPISNAAIELYRDQNGVPAPMPYPLYRVVETFSSSTQGYNFRIGGLRKDGKYYIKAVPDNLSMSDIGGYIGSFYMTPGKDEPKLFKMPSTYSENDQNAGELVLAKGGRLWGYLEDQAGHPIDDAAVRMQALGYRDQQVVFTASCLHDPNAPSDNQISLWDKYYFGFNNASYNSNGKYELKGLSLEGLDFFFFAVEVPPSQTLKKYATPLFYDGNAGTYNPNDTKAITLTNENRDFRVDFQFKPGGIIKGAITYEVVMGSLAQAMLDLSSKDISEFPILIDAYYVEEDGSYFWIGQGDRTGEGNYSVSGLPQGTYFIKAYDKFGFYTQKYFNDKITIINANEINLPSGGTVTGKNISLSLGGLVTGRALNQQGSPIEGAWASAYLRNPANPLAGYHFTNSEGSITAQYYQQTDPNGRFVIHGLPSGSYSIFINGLVVDSSTAYIGQYLASQTGGAMMPNEAEPIEVTVNNPNLMDLASIELDSAGSESGGIISGSISSEADPNIVDLSSQAFYIYLVDAVTGIRLANPFFRFDTESMGSNSLPYSIMAPEDGEYILVIRDQAGRLLPHYYNKTQTTVDKSLATNLTIDHEIPGKRLVSGIDITLRKPGAVISGHALGEGDIGVSGLEIYAFQRILEGPGKGQWKSLIMTTTRKDGHFTLSGLYEGTYVFSVYDRDFNYVAQYYHPSEDAYTFDDAFQWTYSVNDTSPPPEIIFDLKRGGRIAGQVTGDVSKAQVYAKLKGGTGKFDYAIFADPNFIFKGIKPGEYILSFNDPGLDYLPVYYNHNGATTDPNSAQTISVVEGQIRTGVTISFYQQGARINGRILRDAGNSILEPMSDMFVFLYPAFSEEKPWDTEPLQYDISDPNGLYILKGLQVGEYKILIFGNEFRPIIKGLTINPSDLANTRENQDIIFPGDWSNIKYDKVINLEKGLNLIAYPTLVPPILNGYSSSSFLKDIALVSGRTDLNLKTYFPKQGIWRSTSYGNIGVQGTYLTGSSGSIFTLQNGQGLLCYSGKDKHISLNSFPGQTPLWLSQGKNLVGNIPVDPNMAALNDPNLLQDRQFTTRKLLEQLKEDSSISIQTFDAKSGKWQATYWMWGNPSGTEVSNDDSLGYLIDMKKDLYNWYPVR